MNTIDESTVSNLLSIVDRGLTKGLGNPVPGQMCVEAAVCYSLGLDHGDDPLCVAHFLRILKICINDNNWSSNAARAKGLRRLAVAQLGTRDTLNEKEFASRVVVMLVNTTLADIVKDETLSNRCRVVKTIEEAKEAAVAVKNAYRAIAYATAYAADAVYAAADAVLTDAAYAAYAVCYASTGDKVLSDFCENVVQILIDMKTPGCKYLYLTETT